MEDYIIKSKYTIETDLSADDKLTEFGKAVLQDRYLLPGETFQDLFSRVAAHYADDKEHAQRIYTYISKQWFMPATPILSNGGTTRGLPISCFLNEVEDSLEGILSTWNENVWLAARGGGIGTYWGNVRSIGEKVRGNGKTSGIVPFIKVQDSMTLAISQGSLRRGSAAIYLPVEHPEIEEFIELRRPTGGDPNRKALNIHHGVVISDAFMQAVEKDADWNLKSPKDGSVVSTVKARDVWIRILNARVETGEPYVLYIDRVNESIPEHHKKLGLKVKMSNLCCEITLPTGRDHLGKERSAVCCLSSLNVETYEEWKDDKLFIEDVMKFLDNVLQDFIDNAPDTMAKAKYAAMRERSVGLGVMGFHSYLQSKKIPFESVVAKVLNKKIFEHISIEVNRDSKTLAKERGACPDAEDAGMMERFSNKTAIAPTASISIICGNSSPGIEPYAANSFTQKTLTGSFTVKNKHLQRLLEEKGQSNDKVWSSITTNEGSVQHLDFLNKEEKDIFKTAMEINQRWLIEFAADRTPYISQAQSLNLFIPANISKKELHRLHFEAWKKGVKSLYYCRSVSMQRADKVSHRTETHEIKFEKQEEKQIPLAAASAAISTRKFTESNNNYEECLSCQ
jgi:ribonucleoside-diphosphate reductase alpha chain